MVLIGKPLRNGVFSIAMSNHHLNWVNYNDLTVRPNPGIVVNKGSHPQMALIEASEL